MGNKITSFISIWNAYRACMRGKGENATALKFHLDAVSRCLDLCRRLDSREYEVGAYYPFEVYEPKRRLVLALNFEGKVVQHSFCDNALYGAVCRRLITDNYAVQVGKGTHYGLDRIKKMLRHYFFSRKAADEKRRREAGLGYRPKEEWDYADGWVLKGDFKKYFYTLEHGICKALVKDALASIADEDLRASATWLTDLFIDSTDDPGIPIGNQSSQLIALLYLDWMDHWLKDDLGLMYGRYMDDFVIVHEDKEYLQRLLAQIERSVSILGLKLNPKTQILPLKNGIDFLGFHIYLTATGKVVMKVRAKSISNMRRKLRKFRGLVDKGAMELESVDQSYQSWLGHVAHGNCYHLVQKMNRYFYKLFPDLKTKEDANGSKAERSCPGSENQVHKKKRRTHRLACNRPEPHGNAERNHDPVHGQDRGAAALRCDGADEQRLQPQELRQQRLGGLEPPAVGEQLSFGW